MVRGLARVCANDEVELQKYIDSFANAGEDMTSSASATTVTKAVGSVDFGSAPPSSRYKELKVLITLDRLTAGLSSVTTKPQLDREQAKIADLKAVYGELVAQCKEGLRLVKRAHKCAETAIAKAAGPKALRAASSNKATSGLLPLWGYGPDVVVEFHHGDDFSLSEPYVCVCSPGFLGVVA